MYIKTLGIHLNVGDTFRYTETGPVFKISELVECGNTACSSITCDNKVRFKLEKGHMLHCIGNWWNPLIKPKNVTINKVGEV